ncbi:RHS repeat-associated core domain-containing protein [Thermogemmata fonticola]|uniref:RHS repeat-associated core domain-containing protein n=1 Tax=Thermogemmata fonticola TaxID=2755323 RepID=A0A7V8VGM8_9BACT|nr:RHS repeat-associated core domain-containing protein [Thermogemmata fonticola]MBA2227699.1 RHS repeat-associated core domain-containing protein [Thermogemmata fonticola]
MRTHNAQNEITSISGAVLPTYDANGNLTRDEVGRQFVYDAWNRLVEVRDDSGETVKRYAYDGLHRRISETAGGVTTDFYYSDQWQVLEERVGGQTTVQYVWSPVYVDALILRDRDSDGDGTLEDRLWVVQDANYNVSAIFDNSGNVVERYIYDPFGQVTVLTGSWGVRSASAYAWLHLHQGGRFDPTTGLYHFRHRDYSPTLGRWTSLDPLSYAAGDVNLYRYVGNGPTNWVDPFGYRKLTTQELQELLKLLQKKPPLTKMEKDRLKDLLDNFKKDGAVIEGQKEVGIIRDIVRIGGRTVLPYVGPGLGIAITGIGKINEKQYERYVEARKGGATHDEAYTFRDQEVGKKFELRYELERILSELERMK